MSCEDSLGFMQPPSCCVFTWPFLKACAWRTALVSLLESERESEAAQSCPILCDPMGFSLPGSTVHGIFQARILEWVSISFFRRSSWPRDWTLYHLSHQGSLLIRSVSSYKRTNLIMKAPPSLPHLDLITSQRPYLELPSYWVSTWILWEHISVCSSLQICVPNIAHL